MRNRWFSSTQRSLATGLALLAGTLTLSASDPAQAALIDFESVVHGEIVNTQIPGITITATNPNRGFDLAIGFDSNESNTADPDLEAASGGASAWSGGNLEGVDLGIDKNSAGARARARRR